MNPTTINRLVAERGMGYTYGWNTTLGDLWIKPDGTGVMSKYWNPAADMNQAMQVAKAASAKTGLLLSIIEMENGKWFARFAGSEFDATDMNPATAICLAALRAVGVHDEEVNRE